MRHMKPCQGFVAVHMQCTWRTPHFTILTPLNSLISPNEGEAARILLSIYGH